MPFSFLAFGANYGFEPRSNSSQVVDFLGVIGQGPPSAIPLCLASFHDTDGSGVLKACLIDSRAASALEKLHVRTDGASGRPKRRVGASKRFESRFPVFGDRRDSIQSKTFLGSEGFGQYFFASVFAAKDFFLGIEML